MGEQGPPLRTFYFRFCLLLSTFPKVLDEELDKMFDDITKVNYNFGYGKRHAVNDLKNNKTIEVKRADKGVFSRHNE